MLSKIIKSHGKLMTLGWIPCFEFIFFKYVLSMGRKSWLESLNFKQFHIAKLSCFLVLQCVHVLHGYGQSCPGNEGTVDIQNVVVINNNTFTFEVWVQNSGSTTNTMTAFGGGILGLPSGIDGNFTVVQQPSTLGFTGFNPLNPNFNATAGFGGVPIMRWTSNPISSPGPSMPTSLTKFAKFQFQRTSGTALSGTITLSWQPYPSGNNPQIVTYCNGNINPQTLSFADNTLIGNGESFQALPIELVLVEAKAIDRINLIHWVTASEVNASVHIVEKSQNGQSYWKEIGRVPTHGNSTTTQNYQYIDEAPWAKTYYRLKMVDFGGAYEYSKIVSVQRKTGKFAVTHIAPNPTKDFVSIKSFIPEEGTVTLRLKNVLGQEVSVQSFQVEKGENTQELNLSKLPAGTYVLIMDQGTDSVTETIIKQ